MASELVPRPVEVYLVAVLPPLVVLVRALALAVSDQATQEASAAPLVQVVDCSVTRPVEDLVPGLAPARVDLAQAAGLAQDLVLVVEQEAPSNNPLLHARVLAAPHSAPSQKRTTAPM